MNFKFSNILIVVLFTGLLVGAGFIQSKLKNEPLIFMLLFGIVTLVFLIAKKSFKSSIPFYILMGTMFYMNIIILTDLIVYGLNPMNGWIIDSTGQRQRLMQGNWVWGVLSGVILAPLLVVLYHKKIKRNNVFEVSFTILFIILTTVIYMIS